LRSESQGFTLGWVPSALQAERRARVPGFHPGAAFRRPFRPRQEGPSCAGGARVAQDPSISAWAEFRRPFRPRSDWPSCGEGARVVRIPGLHPGLGSVGPSGRDTRGRAAVGGAGRQDPRVSPWAGSRRPFRPRSDWQSCGEGARVVRIPGFHPGLGSVGPSGRGRRGRAAVGGAGRQDPRVSPWAGSRRPFRPINPACFHIMRGGSADCGALSDATPSLPGLGSRSRSDCLGVRAGFAAAGASGP